MMKWTTPLLAVAFVSLLASCENTNPQAQAWNNRLPSSGSLSQVTPVQLYREIGVHVDLLPKGKVGRVGWSMRPRYITIHATENYSTNADAFRHALAMKRGAFRARKRPGGNRTGYLTWHFTVQDSAAVQHLPTREQGEHADFDGPGNRYSIGIEMCENRGSNQAATIDRAAKLAAYLAYVHRLPISNVVPHYHWEREGVSPEHKACPHFFMTNGRPGPAWRWFLGRVQMHYNRIIPGPMISV